jgi:hypothetical protein
VLLPNRALDVLALEEISWGLFFSRKTFSSPDIAEDIIKTKA